MTLPDYSLVVLIGVSGSGKSTLARKLFSPTEVVSSDQCRAMVDDDPNSLDATSDAFDMLHHWVGLRLKRRKLTVVDATNVQVEARRKLVGLAKQYHALPVALVLNLPRDVLESRNESRPDRTLPLHSLRRQYGDLRRGLRSLKREGFRQIVTLDSVEAIDSLEIERQPLWVDRRTDSGPFDIIGDVHGCHAELTDLLEKLGYKPDSGENGETLRHPEGRRVIFVGDLVDRGPGVLEVLRLAMSMVANGDAACINGNHEAKLLKALRGKPVKIRHGLDASLNALESVDDAEKSRVMKFLDGLISHFVLDGGRLVVAHAGLKESMQNRASGQVRSFAMYGETTGEIDAYGLPVRLDWARDYRGEASVVYGHMAVREADWVNNTLCIDTGCVFGGKLTALRWPERELVSVPAAEVYSEPLKTATDAPSAGTSPTLLDLKDVTGRRHIRTEMLGNIVIDEAQSAAALETMSRFALDPAQVVYLPPTMAPAPTCPEGAYLEAPEQAFQAFARAGVDQVICQEKHMGSRAVAMVLQDPSVAVSRFGLPDASPGWIMTRTGRAFFSDPAWDAHVLDALRQAAESTGLFAALESPWILLDAEILPWTAKATTLLVEQYAPTGRAALLDSTAQRELLLQAEARGLPVDELKLQVVAEHQNHEGFVAAWRRYAGPAEKLSDIAVAPFHVLAAEAQVTLTRPHTWHMDWAEKLAAANPDTVRRTDWRQVNLASEQDRLDAHAWWRDLTSAGGEGMVVKPAESMIRKGRKAVQPALKVRGREYLRIIYGPNYTEPANLDRLRERGLGRKQSLALREFALGLEALQRLVEKRPLRQVHEAVSAVLALESEPVDPRL